MIHELHPGLSLAELAFLLMIVLVGASSLPLVRAVISKTFRWSRRRSYGPGLTEPARAVMDLSPEAVVSMSGDGRILDFNDGAERLFGYTREEAVGAFLDSLLIANEEERALHRAGLQRYIETGESRILRKRIPLEAMTRSGDLIPVELVATSTRSRGRVVFVGFLRDLTERRQAESHLRRAREAAEEASRLKSEFLANMSHEIRTPLNAIVGYSALLAEPETDRANRAEWSRVVRVNGRHLLELLDGILDLSKVEAGVLDLRRQFVDLASVLRELGRMMAPRAEEKGLSFSIEVRDGVPRSFDGDALRIRQVLINLLSNAIKFTDTGRVQLILENGPDHDVVVAVEDTGPGIAAEKRDRAFEPFTRIRESGAWFKPGTGLGLDLSRRLTGLMGGTLTVETRAEGGSRFEFRLPAPGRSEEPMAIGSFDFDGSQSAVSGISGAEARFDGKRFLVAEDSIASQQLIEYHLEKWGADVECVEDGLAATQRILDAGEGAAGFDCVLMDMQMPVLDGYEATRQLRQAGFERPIVGVTADAFEDDRARCLAAGCTAFVAKPVDAGLLRRELSQLLGTTPTGSSDVEAEPPGRDHRYADLVVRYRASLKSTGQEIEAALESHDRGRLTRVLHQLKGVAGSYGDDKLSECASVANRALRTGVSLPDVRDLIEEVLDELRALVAGEVDEARESDPRGAR